MKRFALIATAAAAGAFAASAGEMVAYTDIDTNSDGMITETEFVTYKTAKGDVSQAEASEKFAMADANDDGVVTKAEFDAAVEAWKDKKDEMETGSSY